MDALADVLVVVIPTDVQYRNHPWVWMHGMHRFMTSTRRQHVLQTLDGTWDILHQI